MSDLAEQRAFLIALRKRNGDAQLAAQTSGTPFEKHEAWLKRDHQYAAAFRAVSKEIANPPKEEAKPKNKGGRPRKVIAAPVSPPPVAQAPRPEPKAETSTPEKVVERPAPDPIPVNAQVYPGPGQSYTKLYAAEGQELPPPGEPVAPRPPAEPDFVASVEVTVQSDAEQRKMIDQYGELDRRMQLQHFDTARYETLKRAIKGWFDDVPADADAIVEGDVYLLHLSARERERRIRDMRELVDVIGLDKVLELATVAIGALEDLLGKSRVSQLTVDARSGSRRIKAIPKRAAGKEINGTTAVPAVT